ncbi:MAG: HNH endonuclease [Deltaproteobacteria bacterium]|nr:MAG: HNH endonuclease [Deltaproteobacteria bacterium]
MKAESCARKSRENIPANVKHQLLQISRFSCSICGKIPIVFHHIEEWSKEHSNDIDALIPICDSCHRCTHGEGGNVFSKDELYEYKKNPQSPSILKKRLYLDRKKNFSFFIGSNFIENGRKANLIRFPDGSHLTSIDISDGNLKLSILERIVDNEKFHLIKENELIIDPSDIWDMRYSGNSLKIWKIIDSKKRIFIELIIRPDLIVIKRMETTFNGKPFRIFKPRAPHKTKVIKLKQIIDAYESEYREISDQLDMLPKQYGIYKGLDIDTFIKQSRKDIIKKQFEQAILYEHQKEFKWDWPKYYQVVQKLFEDSEVFRAKERMTTSLPKEYERINMHISEIKKKYSSDFAELKGTIAEYGGFIFNGTIMI